jgi:hypothetical protein
MLPSQAIMPELGVLSAVGPCSASLLAPFFISTFFEAEERERESGKIEEE